MLTLQSLDPSATAETPCQRLVASPVARPLIEALDYAQRTNTIGSLRGADMFRSITAPMALAQSQPQVIVQDSKDLRETIARLNERLDEPFVTINIVTGEDGIKQAQDKYQRLMNNKTVVFNLSMDDKDFKKLKKSNIIGLMTSGGYKIYLGDSFRSAATLSAMANR